MSKFKVGDVVVECGYDSEFIVVWVTDTPDHYGDNLLVRGDVGGSDLLLLRSSSDFALVNDTDE